MQKWGIATLGVLAGLAIACVAYVALHARQEPAPPAARDFDLSKAKPEFTVQAFGGTLLGYDVGEWGGKLAFRDAKGAVSDVIADNVQAILPKGADVIVFTGLSHMGENHGAIYLLRPDAQGDFTVTQLHVLDGAPDAIAPDAAAGTVDFNVVTGTLDHRDRWIFLCRRLKADLQLEALANCKVRDAR